MITCNPIAPNFTHIVVGPLALWFSYKTCIAFRMPGTGVVCRENDWGPTTGKHLNQLDGGGAGAKASRMKSDDFEQCLNKICEKLKYHETLLSSLKPASTEAG